MSSIKNSEQANGDYGINVMGDGNFEGATLNFYKQPIKYELLSKLSKAIIESSLNNNEEMNIVELPIELLDKIERNNLVSHKLIYEEMGIYLTDIGEIVEKTLADNSIKLIKIIKTIYLKVMSFHPEYSGDQILFTIEEELVEHIDLNKFNNILNEDINLSISQIVLYVFEKCQILKK